MSDPTRRGFLKGILGVVAGGAAVATAKAEALPAACKAPEWPIDEGTVPKYIPSVLSGEPGKSGETLAVARRLKRDLYQRADEDAIRILKEGFDD